MSALSRKADTGGTKRNVRSFAQSKRGFSRARSGGSVTAMLRCTVDPTDRGRNNRCGFDVGFCSAIWRKSDQKPE
jgi:hypothetical protein